MFYAPEYALPQIGSIIVSLLMLVAALRLPVTGRAAFFALFVWAAPTNLHAVLDNPYQYVDFARLAVLEGYRQLILGPFADHVVPFVLLVASGQLLIAIGLLAGGTPARIAAIGATVFLMAIAPLGVGSAFPSTLIMAAGMIALLLREDALEGGLVPRIRDALRGVTRHGRGA